MHILTRTFAVITGTVLTIALLLGITGHSIAEADLHQKTAPVSPEPILSTPTAGTRQLVVGDTVTDAGTVTLGKVSQIHMEPGARMQVFGTADNAAPKNTAGFVVTNGTIWVSNPVLGNPLSVAADRVLIRQTTGGLMLTQKFDPVSHTILANGYGSTSIQILAADRKAVIAESILPPASTLSVDSTFLTTLESADTPTAKSAVLTAAIQDISTSSTVQNSVHTYIQGDVWRVSHALADLQALLATSEDSSSDILSTLRANLAITPVAQQLLSARVLMSSLAGLTQQPVASLPDGTESAQDIIANIEPYTRLIPFTPLLTDQQQLIATLSKSQKVLSKALGKQPSTDEALRPLLVALADPKSQIPLLAKSFTSASAPTGKAAAPAAATVIPEALLPEYRALLTMLIAQADPASQSLLQARATTLGIPSVPASDSTTSTSAPASSSTPAPVATPAAQPAPVTPTLTPITTPTPTATATPAPVSDSHGARRSDTATQAARSLFH